MPSAYLQWQFHSGERVVARGPLVSKLGSVYFRVFYRRAAYARHTTGWKLAQGLGFMTGAWMWWGMYTEFDHVKVRLPYLKFQTLYSILIWPKFCLLCKCF